ncbi:MAG: hypothetical protein HGA45_03425 [Chloroflexales bacterium]|nr:hypothetical protein [Chloroflexales bacterium]
MSDLCRVLVVGNFSRDLERRVRADGVAYGITTICAGRMQLVSGHPLLETLRVTAEVVGATRVASVAQQFGAGSRVLIEPAHRGLQTRWLYRVVRHPIYAAYLLIVGGFLLSAWSWWNGGVAITWLAVQGMRVIREEALLRQDAEYQRYAQVVCWRLLPGVW